MSDMVRIELSRAEIDAAYPILLRLRSLVFNSTKKLVAGIISVLTPYYEQIQQRRQAPNDDSEAWREYLAETVEIEIEDLLPDVVLDGDLLSSDEQAVIGIFTGDEYRIGE